jgi:hypothetical protein
MMATIAVSSILVVLVASWRSSDLQSETDVASVENLIFNIYIYIYICIYLYMDIYI